MCESLLPAKFGLDSLGNEDQATCGEAVPSLLSPGELIQLESLGKMWCPLARSWIAGLLSGRGWHPNQMGFSCCLADRWDHLGNIRQT